jgi:hypothetical protein
MGQRGRGYNIHEIDKNAQSEYLKRRTYLGDQEIEGKILKWILKKQNVIMRIRTQTSGRLS